MQPGQASGYGREGVAYSTSGASASAAAASSGAAGAAGTSLVGAVGSPGDRIQLAPLRAHPHGGNVTPPLPLQVPLSYPLNHRGGSSSQSLYERGSAEISRGDLRNIGESLRGGGKKNPLSIGSIIDDETR
jgi:hypothetical protein